MFVVLTIPLLDCYYQENKSVKDEHLVQIKSARRNELLFLRSLNLPKEMGILDLCCGKGNVLSQLPKHNYYTLVDKNPKVKIPENFNVDLLVLRNDLCEMDLKRHRDDIWVCINGLWYWKDNFLKNAKEYKPPIIIFNVHSKNINWECSGSYLKREGAFVKYYYDWCHTKECVEPYLPKDEIDKYLLNLGYKMIKYYQDKDKNLSNNFEFYCYKLCE